MSFEIQCILMKEKSNLKSMKSKKRGAELLFSFFVHKCQHHFSKMRLIREAGKNRGFASKKFIYIEKKGVNQKFKMEFEDQKN